jgi:hypothetical protein
MCALTQVPWFRMVTRFLSALDRSAARAVWEAVAWVVVLGVDDAEDVDRGSMCGALRIDH